MSKFQHRIGHRIGPAGMVLAALVALGSGVLLTSGAAQAAPQALALVATKGKVGLACAGRDCSAELTSFCLDAGRFSPPQGTEYRVAGGLIRLTATAEDGRTLALDARSHLRFESARRHLAVRVSVDRAALEALGVDRAEVEVAENVALLPVPEAGDPDPITEGEAALFAGPLRRLGSLVVDGNRERMDAARLTSRMINLLPPEGGAGAAEGEALWRRATAAGGADSPGGPGGLVGADGAESPEGLTPAARKRARGAFELCRYVAKIGGTPSLRHCLQEQHDGFVDFLNSKYWKAIETGT